MEFYDIMAGPYQSGNDYKRGSDYLIQCIVMAFQPETY
jgi:hypothetical protein